MTVRLGAVTYNSLYEVAEFDNCSPTVEERNDRNLMVLYQTGMD